MSGPLRGEVLRGECQGFGEDAGGGGAEAGSYGGGGNVWLKRRGWRWMGGKGAGSLGVRMVWDTGDIYGDDVWIVKSAGLARRRCHVRWKAHKHRRADTGQDTWIFV